MKGRRRWAGRGRQRKSTTRNEENVRQIRQGDKENERAEPCRCARGRCSRDSGGAPVARLHLAGAASAARQLHQRRCLRGREGGETELRAQHPRVETEGNLAAMASHLPRLCPPHPLLEWRSSDSKSQAKRDADRGQDERLDCQGPHDGLRHQVERARKQTPEKGAPLARTAGARTARKSSAAPAAASALTLLLFRFGIAPSYSRWTTVRGRLRLGWAGRILGGLALSFASRHSRLVSSSWRTTQSARTRW